MGFSWEQVSLNNRPADRASDWDAREAAEIAKTKAAFAEHRKQQEHEAECAAYARFATSKATEARKRGDEQRAGVWGQAAANIERGLWTVDKTIASDPTVTAFQGLRTQLLYQGKTAQLKGQ